MKYEFMVVFRPDARDNEIETELKEMKKLITDMGSIFNEESLGKREMMYVIKGHNSGNYFLIQFESESGEKLDELNEHVRLSGFVIRHLLMKLPKGFKQEPFDMTFTSAYELPEFMKQPKKKSYGAVKKPGERGEKKVEKKTTKPTTKSPDQSGGKEEKAKAEDKPAKEVEEKTEKPAKKTATKKPAAKKETAKEKSAALDKKLEDLISDADLDL